MNSSKLAIRRCQGRAKLERSLNTNKASSSKNKVTKVEYAKAKVVHASSMWSSEVLSVITVSYSTWKTTKINGVAIDLFCTDVIGHPVDMVLN